MNTFFRFFYEFISVFIDGCFMIFKGIIDGIKQMFDFKAYLRILNFYKEDFNGPEWVFVALVIVFLVLIVVAIIFLIVFLVRKYIRFRKTLVEQEELLEEVAKLNDEVSSLVKEKEDILDLFKQLGEVGLGTDKNIGGGKFEIEVAQLSISEVNTANAIMLLSLFIPTEEELPRLNLPNSRYELLQRGGYIAGSQDVMFRHLRKKSVYMFNVGSIFSTTIPISGRVIDLRPDWQDKQLHPVFRSGKPFVVPIKMIEI